jgi:hypothetical protein
VWPSRLRRRTNCPKTLAQLDIDPGRRLVEDDHRRLVHQRLGDEHAPLHAAREAAHVGVGLGREVEVGEDLVDPVVVVADAEVAGLDAQRFAHRKERIEDQFLRHHTEQTARSPVVRRRRRAPSPPVYRHPGERDRPGRKSASSCRPVRSEQTKELALGNLQRNAIERLHGAKTLLDAINRNGNRHGGREEESLQTSGRSSEMP